MNPSTIRFSSQSTSFYFDSSFSQLKNIVDRRAAIVLTDENIYREHAPKFRGYKTIVVKPGEATKIQSTVDSVIEQLIQFEADRKSVLIGVGGGVITDLAGFAASVYMRGIPFGFVPTTVLGLVDASIGGKNGIDVGPYKNLVGIIRQPAFILHDMNLLRSLPEQEWVNGFAEIIKHACIKDAAMFRSLEKYTIGDFMKSKQRISELIRRNAMIKIKVVQKDEFEQGERRLLNFGHTVGHAIETKYQWMHGQAVAVGMTYACHFSEQLTGFSQTEAVTSLLTQYQLPTYTSFDRKEVFRILKMDKKRVKKDINFVLLEKIGKGIVKSIPLNDLEKMLSRV